LESGCRKFKCYKGIYNIIWNTNLNTVSGPYHPNLSGIHNEGVFWIGDFSDKKIEQEIKKYNIKKKYQRYYFL
jgi:hypothetical protein